MQRNMHSHAGAWERGSDQKAWSEYEKFNKIQKIESDFDKASKVLLKAQEKFGGDQ